jgi:hypothetical protein
LVARQSLRVKPQLDKNAVHISDEYVRCKGAVAFKCKVLHNKERDCPNCLQNWENVLQALSNPLKAPFLQKLVENLNWLVFLS